MIDTVMVTFAIYLEPRHLRQWVSHPLIFPGGTSLRKYFLNASLDHGVPLDFKYYPPNPPRYTRPWLSMKISIPKALYRNNVQMVTCESEIERAIAIINSYIAGKPCLPKLDFGAGVLWEVDATYNHFTHDMTQDYVRALSKLTYPQRDTGPYPYEGVQFKSDVATTKFYDKHRECNLPTAQGILRQESVLRHTYYIERRMQRKAPTLREVTVAWLVQILNDDLKRLRLQNSIIYDRHLAQDILTDVYGWSPGSKLFSYLVAKQSMSVEQMIARGAKKRTLLKYDRLIADAGVALTMCDTKASLPALSIDVESVKKVMGVVSDT